jgi:hypothetical protein
LRDALQRLAGRIKNLQRQRYAQMFGQLARQVNRYARRLNVRAAPDQDRLALADGRKQGAGGREGLNAVCAHGHGGLGAG